MKLYLSNKGQNDMIQAVTGQCYATITIKIFNQYLKVTQVGHNGTA